MKKQVTKILAAVDLSPASGPQLEWAAELARLWGAQLMVIHVLETGALELYRELGIFEGVTAWPLLEQQELATPWAQAVAEAQNHLAGLLPPSAKGAAVKIERGEVVDQVLRALEEWEAGLLVISTHGWRGLNRLLMGSTAEKLVRASPVAVLAVPAAKND